MVERLMVGLLANGSYFLLEGVPGLAKTLAIKTLASCIDATFNRIAVYPRPFACRRVRYHDL